MPEPISESDFNRIVNDNKEYWKGVFSVREQMTEQTLEPKQWSVRSGFQTFPQSGLTDDTVQQYQAISNGGPSSYYDFPAEWSTLNDYIEHKSIHQWKEHSFHLGNITKAGCRWGDKGGTTKEYDARKIVYSGLRILGMLKGKTAVKEYLMELLNDEQFN